MSDLRQTGLYVLEALKKGGAQKAQCIIRYKETREFNVDGGQFSLYRTLFDNNLSMTSFKNGKKGSISINRIDKESIDSAARSCIQVAQSAVPDEAWDIAPFHERMDFKEGAVEPDMDRFFERTRELMEHIKERHPLILVEQMIAYHVKERAVYMDTNGTEYNTESGSYTIDLAYSAHEGEKSSSFFGIQLVIDSLDKPFIELGSVDKDLGDVEKQIYTVPIEGKFQGVALFTPSCLGTMLYSMLENFAGDGNIINGTSLWKNSLGKKVADERITISMKPLDERILCGERFTGEGFVSEDYDVIKDGVLESFMLSLYVSNKTGYPRAKNSSFSVVMKEGDTPLEDIIKNIDRGIIVGRFSGGEPGNNGEFSGVAKNSFLIENGKITGAVSETMINGNLSDMMKNVFAISKETVCDGTSVLPYAAFGGIVISGK